MKTPLSILAGLALTIGVVQAAATAKDAPPVIEVVTLKMKAGVSPEQFSAVDRRLEVEYVSKRPGFMSRESAPGSDRTWVVIVHWRSVSDADASMKSFEKAAAAGEFMALIEPGTMVMTRYGR